jgi:hypothetical protein
MTITKQNSLIAAAVSLVLNGEAFACCGPVVPTCSYKGVAVACSSLTFPYQSTSSVPLPAKTSPAWGTSVAQIPLLFAGVIYSNFQKATAANLNAMVTGMDDYMLARLSTELKAHDTSGLTPYILATAAEKVSAANLHRLAASFGPAPIAAALNFAPAAVKMAYGSTTLAPTPQPLSAYWWSLGKGAGVVDSSDMYLYDLVLDSYTAGAGGPTTSAVQDATRYFNRKIKVGAVDVIVVAAALLAFYESPTVNRLATATWDWLNTTQSWDNHNGGLQVVTYPGGVDLIPVPVPDPDLPVLPPIEPDEPDVNIPLYGCEVEDFPC